MGNKIITEKDFWKCSSGAVFAQLQGTRTSNKKSTGEVYITVADTSTSSWIDFGCTKNMMLAAIVGALVAIVVAVVVVALVVGTGGLGAIALIGIGGMMAIGAVGGVAGGLIMAAKGALQCGQKNATARTWDDSKDDLIFTRTQAITGNRTMTCSVGGVVKFAPEVKSWMHALALSGLNYVTELAGCALGGAGVGALVFAGAGVAGGSLAIGWPSVPSVMSNVLQGFTGIWGSSRVLFGLDNVANEHAMGNVNDGWDAFTAVRDGGIPEYGMAGRLLTGHAQPTDYMLFLYLLNIKTKTNKPPVEEPTTSGDKDGNSNNKGDKDETNNKAPEDEVANANHNEGESQNKPNEGNNSNTFEAEPLPDGNNVPEGTMKGRRPSSPQYSVLDANGNLTEYGKWYYERPSGFRDGVRDNTWNKAQSESIDGVVRDPVTGEPLNPNEPWDMGHDYGHEFRKHQQSAAERGISRDQFITEHNNYEHYRPEHPSSNRGHQGEAPDDVYYGP